jgi:hypothetical protein
MTVTTWRYHLPSENGEGWAIVFLDSIGCFSALSDYGDYGYRWPIAGWGPGDFRTFLLQCDDDYVLHKIAPRHQYDPDGTLKNVKRRILEVRRTRSRFWTKDRARQEWRLLYDFDNLGTEAEFARWLDNTDMEAAYECHAVRVSPRAVAFVQRVLPRLRTKLREELGIAETARTS